MRVRFAKRRLWALVAGVGCALGGTQAAQAQIIPPSTPCPPRPCPTPGLIAPAPIGAMPAPSTPATPPSAPLSVTPPTTAPTQPTTTPFSDSLAFAPESSSIARGAGEFAPTSDGGYIDAAIPMSQFRLRFDAAYDNNRPDRAEFFYAKCGCFNALDPRVRAPGPRQLESRVDYQEIRAYAEAALSDRFSAFLEVPVRFINPEQNPNETGFGDINFGVKYALIADPNHWLTFQFRTYVPTGDAERGMGTENTELEPGILWQMNPSDKMQVFAEVRDWIPIDGTDFAGNVLRYGIGASYRVIDGPSLRVAPVAELVGWTVLGGKQLAAARVGPNAVAATYDAEGDTIVNAKIGARIGFGNSDLYVGYGRALTGEVWYKDIIRVEYRLRF